MARIDNLGYEEVKRRLDAENEKLKKIQAQLEKQQSKIDVLENRKKVIEEKSRKKYEASVMKAFGELAGDMLIDRPSCFDDKGSLTEEAVSLIFGHMKLENFSWTDHVSEDVTSPATKKTEEVSQQDVHPYWNNQAYGETAATEADDTESVL